MLKKTKSRADRILFVYFIKSWREILQFAYLIKNSIFNIRIEVFSTSLFLSKLGWVLDLRYTALPNQLITCETGHESPSIYTYTVCPKSPGTVLCCLDHYTDGGIKLCTLLMDIKNYFPTYSVIHYRSRGTATGTQGNRN